jgi:hypothetical protein
MATMEELRRSTLRAAVEWLGQRLGANVAALAAAVDELGAMPADPKIGWSDASDRIVAACAWPASDEAVQRRIGLAGNRAQRATAPILRGRRGGGWIAYESVPRRVQMIATAVGLEGPCDPAAELGALVGVSIVSAQASAALGEAWARLGVACDLFVDRAQPPLGPNVWSARGTIESGATAGSGPRPSKWTRHGRWSAGFSATKHAPPRCSARWPMSA